jgi:hypothetical protein
LLEHVKQEIRAMMQLILTACLTVSSLACRETKVDIHEEISELHCALSAQSRIAIWAESHPNWRVARWRCKYKTIALF